MKFEEARRHDIPPGITRWTQCTAARHTVQAAAAVGSLVCGSLQLLAGPEDPRWQELAREALRLAAGDFVFAGELLWRPAEKGLAELVDDHSDESVVGVGG